jgi:hypothetical protein
MIKQAFNSLDADLPLKMKKLSLKHAGLIYRIF